jgi:hypothetical protein
LTGSNGDPNALQPGNQRFSWDERNVRGCGPGTDVGSLIKVKSKRYFMPSASKVIRLIVHVSDR